MAKQLFQGEIQFSDENGVPYAIGTLDFYEPGTSTRKDTWKDPGETQANTNPIVLDAAGRCRLWGVGEYRQVLSDVNGVQIWDRVVSMWPDNPEICIPCSATGKNAIVLTPNTGLQDVNFVHQALATGQAVLWVQPVTNDATGITLNFDAKGALPVYLDTTAGPNLAVTVGALAAGDMYVAYFDQALNAGGGGWHLGGPGLYSALTLLLPPDLSARVAALEALELSFTSYAASGTHGAWAQITIPISATHGGPITLAILWGSETAINAAEDRVVPLPVSMSTPAFIVALAPDGTDATPMLEINTKIVNSFTLSNRSTGSMDCDFIVVGAL